MILRFSNVFQREIARYSNVIQSDSNMIQNRDPNVIQKVIPRLISRCQPETQFTACYKTSILDTQFEVLIG